MNADLNRRILELYPTLAAIESTLLNAALEQAQTMQVPAGTVLFDERQPCMGFPFILSGAIRVIKAAPNGRVLPLYRVLPGETCIVTSSCLLGHSDYNARGETEGETTLLFLPRKPFEQLLPHTAFRDFIFHLFSERIVELMQLVEEVAFRKLDQRLAGLLLGKGRLVQATHQQLADELGSVREIVSRLLKSFAERGWVALGREQIEILDPAALRQYSAM
ncbi:MAG: Crp/Fnr family transcriptional regulator [Sulfuricellaceae bacterium]|nr:Crp/Fnr family transcriptional regulator [Sulfuricellaceae bacterium]